MKLQKLNLKRYKCFREDINFEIAPLTILFGANNSGKTALARAIHLLASSLVLLENNSHEPLLLRTDEIRHGRTFVDLVNGHAIHGKLSLSAELANGSNESLLNVTVQNVEKPPKPDERQILNWCLASGTDRIEAQRKSLDPQSLYDVSVSGREPDERPAWRGYCLRKRINSQTGLILKLRKSENGPTVFAILSVHAVLLHRILRRNPILLMRIIQMECIRLWHWRPTMICWILSGNGIEKLLG